MRLFYTIGIWFYTLGVRVAALFGHSNARLMVQGWSSWREALARLDGRPVVWFHAASLGEFEQARPVLERYVELHPDHQVLLTFFSPSGYEVRKNYPKSQAVCYLPPDLPRIVQAFTAGVTDLRAVFFVKYDFWFNYLGALRQRGVPTYLFSAIFRPDQYFFRWYGGWFRRQLATCYTHIFVQNEEIPSALLPFCFWEYNYNLMPYSSLYYNCCKDTHIIIFSIIGKSITFCKASNKLSSFHRKEYISTFAENYNKVKEVCRRNKCFSRLRE